MDERTYTGVCPDCRHTIAIPGELETFSCVYCGKRLTTGQLLRVQTPAGETETHQRLLQRLIRELPPAIWDEPGILKEMNRSAYPRRLDAYRQKYGELMALISHLQEGAGENSPTQRLAREVVDAIDQWASTHSRGLTTKQTRLEEIKYTLCLLTIPAIRAQGSAACGDLARELHRVWMEKFPRNPFSLTTREEILAGFQPRKLCYITTAVCRQAGKSDDCDELQAFRAFRDDYLTAQPRGKDWIDRYYTMAPGIVMAIDLCRDPEETYNAIWQTYLRLCYQALNRGEPQECQRIYTKMMSELPELLRTGQKIS